MDDIPADFRDRGVAIPPAVAQAVLERDGLQCVVCGTGGDNRLQIHHWYKKRSQGGAHVEDNLCTACHRCHRLLELNVIALEAQRHAGRLIFFVRGSRRGLFPR